MKKIILYTFFSMSIFLFIKCKDEINEPAPEPEILYKVEGIVLFNNVPLDNIDVFLDTVKCVTDSLGYFVFDSLNSQTSSLKINYPQYVPIDTLINISQNCYLILNLAYRSNSFLPLSIGNKWFYNNTMAPRPDSTEIELTIEVVGIEQKANLDFYKLLFTNASSGQIDTSRYFRYMRISADSLYEFACDEVELLAIFNIPLSTIFQTHRCIFSYNVTLYDKSDLMLKYFYRAIGTLDADYYLYFQKGVGINRWLTPDNNYVLDSYYIN